MRAFESCVLSFVLLLFVDLADSTKFKIAYKDSKSKQVKESHPVKRASLVQCAAHCLRKDDCDGFSIDSSRICRILKGQIEEGQCPGDGCENRKGYSVFKKNL
ncbi:hypothetical protein HNY73_017075 [Argiope bruennichi]|uniref:Apple domain-containing protein n=2 Tax=Argiope bruennichi TaxID=94029 RepID=A0A8T0EKV7_ARGBR|nr:hypothetical protein HNY73_017075 [Argiope bruennichi]